MPGMSKTLVKMLFGASMFLLAPLAAYANLIFTYDGNPFYLFPPGSPYTTANSITFSFEVSDPLPADLFHSDAGVNPLNWLMTDGLQTASSADPSWTLGFAFDTDAAGAIVGWLVGASSATGVMQIKHWPGGGALNDGYEFALITGVGSSDNDLGCSSCPPFPTWTVTDTAAVPEPGSFALFGAGLAMLALLRRSHVGKSRRRTVGV